MPVLNGLSRSKDMCLQFAADRPGLSHENTEAETYIRLNHQSITATEVARHDPDASPELQEDP